MYPRRHVSTMLLRHLRNFKTTKKDLAWSDVRLWKRRQINLDHLDRSIRTLARTFTEQFQLAIAQRVRETIQIIQLYTRIWNQIYLRELRRAWNHKVLLNRRQFIVASTLVTSYNWDKERITDREMHSCCKDIDAINKLKETTVVCPKCHLRLVIDVVRPNVTYCNCRETVMVTNSEDEWEPFIEREDMLVWRKNESDGLYAYKIYGCFDDVTAEDFLQVQINVDYRKEWDETAKELIILDTDPCINNEETGTCDIVYWEMIWPALFANRDYVYQRRWMLDKEKGIIVIISKVTDHPNAPERSNNYRVSSYWSYMVIKPCRGFDEEGIEFSLTYFDDPGISLSYAITSWVAMRGFPDYLCKMREASKQYKSYKMSKEQTTIVPKSADEQEHEDKQERPILSGSNIDMSAKSEFNDNINQKSEAKEKEESNVASNSEINDDETEKDIAESDDPIPDENQGFLSYFFITRLFA